MSTAPAAPAPAPAHSPPAKGGKKKLMMLIAAVLVVLLGGGGGAFLLLKKPHDAEDGDGAEVAVKSKGKGKHAAEAPTQAQRSNLDPKHPPIFVPLDPFTVNLADRESERYAQVGVTLEIDDAKTSDQLKLFMPAIRNNILMVLSNRSATQLLTTEGKEKLARSILYAAVRPLGYQADDDDDDDEEAADTPKKKKKKKRGQSVVYPVRAVHFSNFIIQ